ncbi:MAG: hypothetical protein ABL908_18260, partial [Hyphomicrobium sp.]
MRAAASLMIMLLLGVSPVAAQVATPDGTRADVAAPKASGFSHPVFTHTGIARDADRYEAFLKA